MHTNRLASEKSPYLLQHAHNPVDWYAWGPEAFEKSRSENKPIFLSIGYSTCHWCHVMERESFENEALAEILNRSFVAIKVDREERPDVDRIYMTFVQATTGGGGWPMSVWLTPDLKPFFGGTYFPPETRYGHPGFGHVLNHIATAWQTDRQQILESGRDIVAQLGKNTAVVPGGAAADGAVLDSGYFAFRRAFDSRLGGFGGAPKFPRPSVHNFLLRYFARTGNQEARDMVLMTLQSMALGGMNDQLGGGFHRYSVDERWFVPHFEKMLYDQAQLASSYLEAAQITGDLAYADVARGIFDYVRRDMTGPGGGFYSAEDADSVADPAHPHEKGEGAFYIWSYAELRQLVEPPALEWFSYRYGVQERGNVTNDPHQEFTGRNILFQAHTLEETASHFEQPEAEVGKALARAEFTLFEARGKRIRPHLDDKILTAWNGLMISAFALGGASLREPAYAESARRAADFIITHLYNAETGILLRRYRQGDAAIPGFLDDYAFFAQGLLDLYEAQFELRDLELAVRLTEKQIELFADTDNGAFFSTTAGDASLVMRVKEDYDGAEPSGNSVATLNLLRLAQITGREDFAASAQRALRAFSSRLNAGPVSVPQMAVALAYSLSSPRQIVIAGERGAADTRSLIDTVAAKFVPFKIVLLADGAARDRLTAWIPSTGPMGPVDGRAAAYVCQNYTCQLPVTSPEELAQLLQ